jgi:hypothetical protein
VCGGKTFDTQQAEIARLLVECGAEVNASQPGHDGWTPLHLAAWSGNARAVAFLLSAGADISLADWYTLFLARTPLQFNCQAYLADATSISATAISAERPPFVHLHVPFVRYGQTSYWVAMMPNATQSSEVQALLRPAKGGGTASWGVSGSIEAPPDAVQCIWEREPCPCGTGLLLHAEECRSRL